MPENLRRLLEREPMTTSAPCRLDMGGTLDIKTIYLPLARLAPMTFNLAIDLRTSVSLFPYEKGLVKVTSRGFESVEFPAAAAPYQHPLGLMFAIADYYSASGLHIIIESASPPRSALGGSSAAAVALVCALAACRSRTAILSRKEIALVAHAVEEGVARMPCGLQDQLASAYGGINAWRWVLRNGQPDFEKTPLLTGTGGLDLRGRFLVAYCGVPHASSDINGRWMNHFIQAEDRTLWEEIVGCSRAFIEAFQAGRLGAAVEAMNRESDLRKQMTPEVFDDMGELLAACARECNCGVRFTGAGGGGCVWALGETAPVRRLKTAWRTLLAQRPDACLLEAGIDYRGLIAPSGVTLKD